MSKLYTVYVYIAHFARTSGFQVPLSPKFLNKWIRCKALLELFEAWNF